ncbi:MAG: phosphoesterase [Verrucomicrobia bacterium]|nr:phosphoesterase [Verrucomicrobiota bacterium]MBV8277040.1 phosphoesterase [Verrucomicrobiota bacterium]
MRPIYIVCLSLTLGLGFTPALTSAKEEPLVEQQPNPDSEIAAHVTNPKTDAATNVPEIVKLLREKVKYVFVIFQENRAFDQMFGTFPGAHGFFSQPEDKTPGFTQYIQSDKDGSFIPVQPFRIGQDQDAWDIDDMSHSHVGLLGKMHIVNGTAQMDDYAFVEEGLHYTTPLPTLQAKQFGYLTMAYIDGNTIPFLWYYASRFTLFDNHFQTIVGPSSPDNVALIAGQSGTTQWVLHPSDALTAPGGNGVPTEGDGDPLWGSSKDPLGTEHVPNTGSKTPQINLTFASLPLTLAGNTIASVTANDLDPAIDLADVQEDLTYLSTLTQGAVNWRWYEEGFTFTGYTGAPDVGGLGDYIAHHNAPQYFGYVSANTQLNQNLQSYKQFFADITAQNLGTGGVFYIKGGFQNQDGLVPLNKANNPTVLADFVGDDDHEGYSDSQISEALVADVINAIAKSSYWGQCAIIISWDDSEGTYDHVPPTLIASDPFGGQLSRGPRVPLVVISPFAQTHVVSHEIGDTNSIIKFINLVFNLPALEKLPDEFNAQQAGKQIYNQDNLGPQDDPESKLDGDLTSAFSINRLKGHDVLPASYVEIPDSVITALPHWGTDPLKTVLHITPTDAKRKNNPIPTDFNPRPSSQPNYPN